MLLRYKISVPVMIILGVILFGGHSPSTFPTKQQINNKVYDLAGTTPYSSTINRILVKPDCMPKYSGSTFVNGQYCLTKVAIGSVVVNKAAYKVHNKVHCSSIVGKKVRSALASSQYNSCVSGQFL